MNIVDCVASCQESVRSLLPELGRPVVKLLGALVAGAVRMKAGQLRSLGVAIPGPAHDRSKERRAQRLVANTHLDVSRAQRRLIAHILGRRHGRVDLLLDATTNGRRRDGGRTVTLMLAIGWRGRALPLIWHSWPAAGPQTTWAAVTRRMVQTVATLTPPDVQIVLLADRGLSGRPLALLAQSFGWHYLLRMQANATLRDADGTVCALHALVPRPGMRVFRHEVNVFPPKYTHTTTDHRWSTALSGNVVAVRALDSTDPWLLITDLPASMARCTEYRHRTWHEEMFRDLKSTGMNWQRSRIQKPEHADRLLLVLTLALLWVFATGQRVIRRGDRVHFEPRARRALSIFQLGLQAILRCFTNDTALHCTFHLLPLTRPTLKLS